MRTSICIKNVLLGQEAVVRLAGFMGQRVWVESPRPRALASQHQVARGVGWVPAPGAALLTSGYTEDMSAVQGLLGKRKTREELGDRES